MKNATSRDYSGSFKRLLDDLIGASRIDLKERWRALYDTEPPEKAGQDLLRRAIAYRLQEREFGGLTPATRRLLERVVNDAKARNNRRAKRAMSAPPGTVLLREWHGKSHQVTVLDRGAVYRGKRYRSLSEIARVITGAHWSGPAFFGLKSGEGER